MTTDIPSTVHQTSKVSPSWLNRLLDAVRRRTLIQGRGIQLQSTPNGTIISALVATKGSGGVVEGEPQPWDIRMYDGYIQVYIPQGREISVIEFLGGASATPSSANYSRSRPEIINDAYADGWYAVCPIEPTIDPDYIPSNGIHAIRVALYRATSSTNPIYSIAVQVHVTGSQYYYTGTIPENSNLLYVTDVGVCRFQSQKITVAYSTSKQNSFYAMNFLVARNGDELPVSAIDGRSVTYFLGLLENKVDTLANRLPSGSSAVPALSSELPKKDSGNGQAGSSTGAAHADHIHPLQVSADLPEPIPVEGFGEAQLENGNAGSSTSYARADHVHPFPLIVANEDNEEADVTEMMPDGIGGMATGQGGVAFPIGALGGSFYAAPIDHSHPLNFDSDVIPPPIIKATGATADYATACVGSESVYALGDHTHIIEGWTWLANDPDLGTGAPTVGVMKPDSSTGEIGDEDSAAPIDHSHPLNVRDGGGGNYTGTIELNPSSLTGVYGESRYYVREDHQHPLPTIGNGATGVGSGANMDGVPPSSTETSGVTIAPTIYGTGATAAWNRDLDYVYAGETGQGALFPVCVGVRRSGTYVYLFFRNLRIDRSGLCRELSAVQYGIRIV